jgi:hypothetical protein
LQPDGVLRAAKPRREVAGIETETLWGSMNAGWGIFWVTIIILLYLDDYRIVITTDGQTKNIELQYKEQSNDQ